MLSLMLLLSLVGQRNAKVPDTDPEVERKSFKVAKGFEVNLFASDPLLAKPLQMNFDPAGRLWVASSAAYPQIKPGQKADDKILVLEDTKGVGKADKVTVFSDGLLIPTGLEPGDGGVYVINSTDLEHHSDPKGTGKATKKRVVLSGFGTEDTHHMVHTLRWGHDGNLYFNQSVYIHTHMETPHGPRRLGGGGIWQLRPDTLKAEVFTRGMVNPWGHHFDRWGQSFATDGAGFQGVQPQIPGGAYFWAAKSPRLLSGVNPGHPKYCGCEIVSGRALPDDWQGDLVTCDFRANRVVRFKLAPNGAGYSATLMPDVIKATHPAFRPIDVKMGPDGAIYVADWYNPIIQHGEVDFRDPRRDHTHGRIWRITAKGRKTLPNPHLEKKTPAELVEALKAPEGWTRHFARRQLWELGTKKSLPAVQAWKPTTEPDKLEKLWTLQTFASVDEKLLEELLDAKDYRVRAAAVRVLGAWADKVAAPLSLLSRRIADDAMQVRLEAVCALRAIKSPRAAEVALRVQDRPMDQYLDYCLWLTMRELEKRWLPALQAGTFAADTRGLAFALDAVGSGKVVKPLLALVKSGKLKGAERARMLGLLARVGGPGELDYVLKEAGAGPGIILPAVEEAARERGVRPTRTKLLLPLIRFDRSTGYRLAGLYKLEEARVDLVNAIEDKKEPERVRRAALAGLADLGGDKSKKELARIVGGQHEPAIRRAALSALARLDLAAAVALAPALLADEKGEGAADLFDAFLQRKGGAAALAKALAGKKLPADVARVGMRAARTTGRDDAGLGTALAKAGGIGSGPRRMSPAEIKDLVALAMDKGDAARGEAVYRRSDMQCMKCHAIGGAGGAVGPDLSSIGGSAQPDYLAESLLLPSKAIKEGYHALLVTTKRGRQFTGVKVRQTATALVLRTNEDKEITIPLKSIETQAPSKVSLMPEGMVDALTRAELADLVRFLASLGKGEKYSVGRASLARRWQVLVPDKAAYAVMGRKGLPALAASGQPGLTWEPAYGTVAGLLPTAGLPRLKTFGKDGVPLAVVRTTLAAASAAKAKLSVGDGTGLTFWLDGEAVGDSLSLDLKPGTHELTVAVALKERKAPLRIEIAEAPPGVRFVGGK